MNTSISVGIQLLCECLQVAIATYEEGNSQQALQYIRSARETLQWYEQDLLAELQSQRSVKNGLQSFNQREFGIS